MVGGFGSVLLLSPILLSRRGTNKPSVKTQRTGCNVVASLGGWFHPNITLVE